MRYTTGPCPNAAIEGLGVCGPCLKVILSEPDPGRRRSLAALPNAPIELVDRLAHDPDAGVRARVAGRPRLDRTTLERFVDPRQEPSPIVRRALAATRPGAAYGSALAATDDRSTLLILATNPATSAEVLDRLSGHPDPTVAATVAATRSGLPPASSVIDEVLSARAVPSQPLTAPPPGTPWPGPPTNDHSVTSADPRSEMDRSQEPASHRGLVIGFVVVVAALAVGAIIVLTQSTRTTRHLTTSSTLTAPATAATPSTTRTEPPTSSLSLPTTTRPASSDPRGDAVTLDIAMTATSGRFCRRARLRLDYEAPLAYVIVTDDAGRELWQGQWPSGTTRTIGLVAPSTTLNARITTRSDPDSFHPTGSVTGKFC